MTSRGHDPLARPMSARAYQISSFFPNERKTVNVSRDNLHVRNTRVTWTDLLEGTFLNPSPIPPGDLVTLGLGSCGKQNNSNKDPEKCFIRVQTRMRITSWRL
ncbi:hypothetical protein AVEN_42800-1 [Araneus ventricosus]|uniref:Uncharacterized protein n=1 Tax=Araneus ventricosus TaxID=182803 RepID=A0A4Y2AEM8_ARAVE|nr:hypothetical protein AVEN_42800-1 [Araneus ventricosus]